MGNPRHQKYFSGRSVKLSAVVSRRSRGAHSFVFMRTLHEDSWLIFPKLQMVRVAPAAGAKSLQRSCGDKWSLLVAVTNL